MDRKILRPLVANLPIRPPRETPSHAPKPGQARRALNEPAVWMLLYKLVTFLERRARNSGAANRPSISSSRNRGGRNTHSCSAEPVHSHFTECTGGKGRELSIQQAHDTSVAWKQKI
jgi:hypothetical protein